MNFVKINIGNYFSYKSYWYILKDLSNLDLTGLYLVSDSDSGEEEIDEDYFWALWEDGHIGLGDLTIVETNVGNFVYNKIEDDFAKEFIRQNSKVAPCGFFGSYRTVDNYKIGIAEKGEITRFLSFEEADAIIEGEPTEFEYLEEDKVGEDFSSQIHFFNEDRVCRYAKWFVGYDYEEQDVEVIRIRSYSTREPAESVDQDIEEKKIEPAEKTVENKYDCRLPQNAKAKIISHLEKYKVPDLALLVAKKRGENAITIACKNVNNDPQNYIYVSKVYDVKNERIVNEELKRCINAILVSDPNNENENSPLSRDAIEKLLGNYRTDILTAIIDVERKFMFNVMKIQKKGKKLKPNIFSVLLKGKIYHDLDEFTLKDFYSLFIKKLK